ncbi:hypothetical protein ACIOKA_38870, partial [Streptomyces anulatus]
MTAPAANIAAPRASVTTVFRSRRPPRERDGGWCGGSVWSGCTQFPPEGSKLLEPRRPGRAGALRPGPGTASGVRRRLAAGSAVLAAAVEAEAADAEEHHADTRERCGLR